MKSREDIPPDDTMWIKAQSDEGIFKEQLLVQYK